MVNQTGSVDGQKGTKHVLYLNPLNTHVHSHIHTRLIIQLRQPNFPGRCCSSGSTKNSLSYLMTSARREKNKGSGSAHSQQSPLFWSHTHRASYTPASSLLCFNACQRRLKRPEVHNSEENKQADENMGSNREKKRREYKSEDINGCLRKDIRDL